MQFKYSPEQTVKFTYRGKEFEGVIRGKKEGKEPMYMIWVGDQWGWVRESLITSVI